MNKSKYSEKQIYFVLEQAEKGADISDICNVMGISQATFYNWRNRYGSIHPDKHPAVLKLREENLLLKRAIQELEADKKILLAELKKRR